MNYLNPAELLRQLLHAKIVQKFIFEILLNYCANYCNNYCTTFFMYAHLQGQKTWDTVFSEMAAMVRPGGPKFSDGCPKAETQQNI